MTANSTFLDAMRDAAVAAGDARGFRFYANPTDSVFASYAQLDRQARADAAALAAMGHAPGEVAVLAFEPGLDFIRALYATFYAGLVAAPVPVAATRQPDVAVRRLEAIVRRLGEPPRPHGRHGAAVARPGAGRHPRGRGPRADRLDRGGRRRLVRPGDHGGLARDPAVHLGVDRPAEGRDGEPRQPRRQRGRHRGRGRDHRRIPDDGVAPALPRHGPDRPAAAAGVGGRRQRAHIAEPVPPSAAALAQADHAAPLDAHGRSRLRLRPLHAPRDRRPARRPRPVLARGRHHGR